MLKGDDDDVDMAGWGIRPRGNCLVLVLGALAGFAGAVVAVAEGVSWLIT